MKKVLRPQDNSRATRELQVRVALSNRPRLKIGMERLDKICSILAKNKDDRAQFVKNPASYLQHQAVPVSSCAFTQPVVFQGVPQTSEVCSTTAVSSCTSSVTDDTTAAQLIRICCPGELAVGGFLVGVDRPNQPFSASDFAWEQGTPAL